ncbi:MAG: phosphodiester glycosidase family protein [bacterium]
MKKYLLIIFIIALVPLSLMAAVNTGNTGKILTKNKLEFWYINPLTAKRHYVNNVDDFSLLISRVATSAPLFDLQQIAQNTMTLAGDATTSRRYAGMILYDPYSAKDLWYINPITLKKHYLGQGLAAYKVFANLAATTSAAVVDSIPRARSSRVTDTYSSYERKTVKTSLGDFVTDIVMIDLANPNLKIITETADNGNCKVNCKAKQISSFIEQHNAFAAINGTYFDTSRSKLNYYFFPVYNSRLKKFINEDQLKWWTTGPIMVFDMNNKFYYFKDSRDFKSVKEFEIKNGVKIQAAIGNKPRLVEEGMNYLIDWEVDQKQREVKTLRNAIAYKQGKLYLVVTQKSRIQDLAEVLTTLGMEYGLNLDGGYSTALFYDDKIKLGPGRDIPNAILFSYKDLSKKPVSANSATMSSSINSEKNN